MADKQDKFFDAPIYFSRTAWLDGGKLIGQEITRTKAKIGERQRQMIELKGKLVELQWAIGDWLLDGENGGLKSKSLKSKELKRRPSD